MKIILADFVPEIQIEITKNDIAFFHIFYTPVDHTTRTQTFSVGSSHLINIFVCFALVQKLH